MTGFYQIKTIGKKRPVLSKVPFELSGEPKTLRELLYVVTASEVERYRNLPDAENNMLPWLTDEKIQDKASVGKIGFGRRYGNSDIEIKKAGDNACQCFEDGLFRVFIEEREVTGLDEELMWKDGSTLTFIRLTFLTGGWL